jgi:bifunctional N-acetylglucosamine-1-phosphate-uridyltransferase/glucosamine-1-phosphate-acetyltransferase GlmU-like protein
MKELPHTERARVCAVVPAAGRGSRLGLALPKVFAPILPGVTIWDAIHRRLAQVAGHIVLVLSPDGLAYARNHAGLIDLATTELGEQSEPRGMGDAIFGCAPQWQAYENILIVWGDQFNLSPRTLRACLDRHFAAAAPCLTLPLVRVPQPYVEYVFDETSRLRQVRQAREGDACTPHGLADIGVFLLTGGERLRDEWARYAARAKPGAATGEINFLPFLAHLSSEAGWAVNLHETDDPAEAVGINTPDDLAFARRLLQKEAGHE